MKTDFSTWPSYTAQEVEAVNRVLLSNKVNYWTGLECAAFEREFASFVDARYSISVANGTVALDLAFKALKIKQGDEVVVTPRTFFASVSSIINAGATPVFADIDENTQNITAETIQRVLSPKTRAILCVHLAGWPCDMDPIMELARINGLYVVEDCAQAHGAKYKGRSVGSIGDIGCWSFCQDKIMTTGGEGGMVTTNSLDFWSLMWSYKDHGKSYAAMHEKDSVSGFKWVHEDFGTNWRMTEMQAAIGRVQLQKMAQWTLSRNANARAIWREAKLLPGIRVPNLRCFGCKGDCDVMLACVHAAYKCYVFVEAGAETRDKLAEIISAKGVPCFQGTCPEVYLEKAFDVTNFRPLHRLPVAKRLGETSLMFLCHPTLTEEEVEFTCTTLRDSVLELNGI